NDAQSVGHFAEFGQMFAESQAGRFRRDFLELAAVGVPRLHVEGVGLRRAAGHPEQNAMPPPLGIVRELISQYRKPATGAWAEQRHSAQKAKRSGFEPLAARRREHKVASSSEWGTVERPLGSIVSQRGD